MRFRSIVATIISCVLIAAMSSCGGTSDSRQQDLGKESQVEQSQDESAGSAAEREKDNAMLTFKQMLGTTWKTTDGTTYTFSTETDSEEGDPTDSYLPDGLTEADSTYLYVLLRNGERMSGNNGSGIWYSLSTYFPSNYSDFSSTWSRNDAGYLFLHVHTDNNDEYYTLSATESGMTVVHCPEDPDDSDDRGFSLAFEELADAAQLNHGIGELERVE